MKQLWIDGWLWMLVVLAICLSESSAQAAERITPQAADFSQTVHEEAVAFGRARAIVHSCQLSEDLITPKRRLIRSLEALLAEKDVYASEDIAAWTLEGARSVSLPVNDCGARAAYLREQRSRDEALLSNLSVNPT